MIADFADARDGGFFFTADDHESLLARPKDPYDGALPGGNSVAVLDLLALHRATGERALPRLARKTLEAFSTPLAQNPAAMPLMLVASWKCSTHSPDRPEGVGLAGAGAPTDARRSPGRHGDGPTGEARTHRARPRGRGGRQPGHQGGWHLYANPTGVENLKPTTLGP